MFDSFNQALTRQREKIWDGPARWTGGGRGIDLVVKREDSHTWRDMVTNSNWHGTPP